MSDFISKNYFSNNINIIDNYLDSFMDKDEEKKNAKVKNLGDDFEIIDNVEDDKVADDFYDAGEDEIYLNAKKAGSEEKNLVDDFVDCGNDDIYLNAKKNNSNDKKVAIDPKILELYRKMETGDTEESNFDDISDNQRLTGSYIKLNYNLPTKKKDILKNIKVAMPQSTIGHWLGRGIQKVVNHYNSDITSSKSLTSTEEKINAFKNKKCLHPLPELKYKKAKPFSMTTEQMGQATGFGKGTRVSPFDKTGKLDYKKVLFGKEGIPLLSDIKQDPNLQDCWFLSSISAVLTTLGPTSITRLFSKSENPNNVIVRLGEHTYDVPLGRIKKDGLVYGAYEFGSKSANWVVALENAMMMHRACHNDTARDVEMSMHSALEGLAALLGHNSYNNILDLFNPCNYGDDESYLQEIRKKINNGFPVVLGHHAGTPLYDVKGNFNSLDTIRVTGIAAAHAVTVLNINDDEKKVEVLDPYGQVKKIPFSYIRQFDIRTIQKY